ncbi:MAG TPA: hypothetical protein VEL76_22065 [Gemmataceae bacterium]|nr:hypothetical protein [Gemmataceae bacterium]
MSTFYVLPPRPLPARPYADFVRGLLPGLDLSHLTWGDLGETLTSVLGARANVFLIHREDLPEGEDPARALTDGFGAEAGDEVVEVPAAISSAGVRRWRLESAS